MSFQRRYFFVFIVFTVVLGFVLPVSAQENSLYIHIDWVDVTQYPQVTLYLSAWDANGVPLKNLSPEYFILSEDGGAAFRPDRILPDDNARLSVGLVLDISESMTGKPITDAKAASARFLDRLEEGDRAAMIAFSDQLDPDPQQVNSNFELTFNDDLDTVYNLVESLEANGQTHLYNAAAKVVTWVSDEPEGHRAILLLTDGRNEPANVGDSKDAIQLAVENNIPFFVIGLGKDIDEPYLRGLANETGGLFRTAPTSAELAHLFTDMAALLKTQYQITYESKIPADGASHSLNVTLLTADGKVSEDYHLGKLPLIETKPEIDLSPTAAIGQTSTPTEESPEITPTPNDGNSDIVDTILSIWYWIVALFAFIAGIWRMVLRSLRKEPVPEVCRQCGYDLTGMQGACPQCGETRRLPKSKK